VVRLDFLCRGGCEQQQVCTSTVTDAWPSDEDSPTTVQLLPPRPSTHTPQCDGVQQLVWRAHPVVVTKQLSLIEVEQCQCRHP
jgi:hypothetical protein